MEEEDSRENRKEEEDRGGGRKKVELRNRKKENIKIATHCIIPKNRIFFKILLSCLINK